MGRTLLPDSERRCHRIAVRLSPGEVEIMEAHKHEAQTLAGHIRCAALKRPRPDPVPEVNRIALNLLREHGQGLNDKALAGHRANRVAITGADLTEVRNLL